MANSSFINDVEEALKLTEEIKKLEARKKTLTESIKTEMLATGQDVFDYNGSKIQLIKSTRVSVKKGMKEKLILFLKQKNLGSCITLNPDINKESLETEINVGNVSQSEINQYMNFSEVNVCLIAVSSLAHLGQPHFCIVWEFGNCSNTPCFLQIIFTLVLLLI